MDVARLRTQSSRKLQLSSHLCAVLAIAVQRLRTLFAFVAIGFGVPSPYGTALGSEFKVVHTLLRDFLVHAGLSTPDYAPLGDEYHLSVAWHLMPKWSTPAPSEIVVTAAEAALQLFEQYGIYFHTAAIVTHAEEIQAWCDVDLPLGSLDTPGTRIEIFLQRLPAKGNACYMPSPLRCGTQVDSTTITPLQLNMLRHEIGHTLGLYHTFQGSSSQTPDPNDPDAVYCGFEGWDPEEDDPYEDEPNACGDAVADTPFMYDVNLVQVSGVAWGEVDSATCEWTQLDNPIWAIHDLAGKPSSQIRLASPTNLMHYNNYSCQSTFSDGQVRRMKVAIERGKWPLPEEWTFGGRPWAPTGGTVPSPQRYLFHGVLYPQEEFLLPRPGEAFFVSEGLVWTQTYASVAGASIVDRVAVRVLDDLGVPVYDSQGFVANLSPSTLWVPALQDVGESFTAEATFKNQYSPYTHTDTVVSFVVEDIMARQETILQPLSGHRPAGPISISWTTDSSYRGEVHYSELVLDIVDVLLSRNGGQSYPESIALGEANDGGYVWVPAYGDYAGQARIKLVWHNIVNSATVDDESDTFSFGGIPLEMVNRSQETGLAGEVSGPVAAAQPYAVAAFNYTAAVPDVLVSHLGAEAQIFAAETLHPSGAPLLKSRRAEAFVSHQLDAPVTAHRGIAVGSFDSNASLWSASGGDLGPDLFLARETGARIYRNLGLNGQLYPQYKDVITTYFGSSTLFNGSWCGQWADVNGDGLVDLVVGRATLPSGGSGADLPSPETLDPATIRLFLQRNETHPQRPGFDEVASSRGLTSSTATIALLVVDLDGDNDREIVTGDLRTAARGGATGIYGNDGSGNFTILSNFSAGAEPASVSGLAAVDIDRDGKLDLVVARQSSAGILPAQVFRNLGSLSFASPVDLDLGISQSGVTAFDHDANQTPDLIFLPEQSGDTPRYWANFSTPGEIHLLDRTSAVGLDETGTSRGVAAADFDGDGRTDLYLGRTIAGGHFFYRAEKPAPIPDEPLHIAIALEGGDGGNALGGDGAVVTLLRNGVPLSSQSYGLPAGGSQSAQPVQLAVPDDGASYTIQTQWPEGHVQTQAAQLEELNVIQDLSNPAVQLSSMQASYQPGAGGTMSFTIEWNTARQAVHSHDRGHLTSTPSCLPGELIFGPDDGNVTMECSLNANGTEHHKLTIANMTCIPQCLYTWWCENATNFVSSNSSANPKTLKTKICVQ